MGAIHSSINPHIMELQTLLHHSYTPAFGYYLHVKSHMTWADFIKLLGPTALDWDKCMQCRRTWDVISTLSDTKGQPVIFRDSMVVYPEYAREAITKFKESFRATEFTDGMCYYPGGQSFNDGLNFGRECTNGHVHIFLESNLEQQSPGNIVKITERQRMVKMVLPKLEKMASKWSPDFFNKASQVNYGRYTDALQAFCDRMIGAMDIVKVSPRMLRPILIQEISKLCVYYQMANAKDWQDSIHHLVKLFRRRSCIDYTARELIVRNFILDRCRFNYEWPVQSTYSERIAAIALRNAVLLNTDVDISCFFMGASPVAAHRTACITAANEQAAPYAQDEDGDLECPDTGYDHVVAEPLRKHALGVALKAYLAGDAIMLGSNQHRLQVLFYHMTGDWQSMPGLSTAESCVARYLEGMEDFEFDAVNGEILAGFMGSDLGLTKEETLYNALVAFTSEP